VEIAENFECPKCKCQKVWIVKNSKGASLVCSNEECSFAETLYITPTTLICPKCSSTAVTTGARGINGFWGAIGASKTVNRCGNCGNMWSPKG